MVQAELQFKPEEPPADSDEGKVLAILRANPGGLTTGELIRSCYVACITKAKTRLVRRGWPVTTTPIEHSRQYLWRLDAN